ncbi:MAG: NAD(P)H-dependent oxidoreductase [Flavobacteriaceae bacterium]
MILAFAGSNSSTSINYNLVKYTAGLVSEIEVQVLNMANYPFPLYSEDYENSKGFSNSLMELRDDIRNSQGLIISVNEHNSNPSSYFKNLIDWLSRLERNFFEGKQVLLMSASPGARGAIGALGIVEKLVPRFGGEVAATFSLPSYFQTFDPGQGIIDKDLAAEHQKALKAFLSKI